MLRTGIPRPRRALLLAGAALVVAVPAGLIEASCRGERCRDPSDGGPRVPFCSLPTETRAELNRGFRAGRSPDVFAIAEASQLAGADLEGTSPVPWPGLRNRWSLPIVFWGHGIDGDADLPTRIGLDAVAPTLASVGGIDRPHPEVRSGEALPLATEDEPPRLLVLIAWKTVDADAASLVTPYLRRGTGTLEGSAGSLPLDPAALLTTLGTGATPDRHGITGSLLRDDAGRVTPAWSDRAPGSVIAALGDDLIRSSRGAALVGLIATHETDRGLVGRDWYLRGDEVRAAVVATAEVAAEVERTLTSSGPGFGSDGVTDLLAVALEGGSAEIGAALRAIERTALEATRGSVTFALAGAGVEAPPSPSGPNLVAQADAAATRRRLIAATLAGGIFLDQERLARQGVGSDTLIESLRGTRLASGAKAFRDVFPATALTFARYC